MQLNDLVKPLAGERQTLDRRRLNGPKTSLLAAVSAGSAHSRDDKKNGRHSA